MAADVSRQIKSDSSSKSCLITRDFLGAGLGIDSKELDLDLHVPSGWEKRLDLKSGKVYLQRCNSTNSSSDPKMNHTTGQISSHRTQYGVPSHLNPTLNLLEESNLDLKLVSNSSASTYTSVCTLDKVKSALDRAERTSGSSSSSSRKRWMIPTSVRSPTNSSVSNSSSISVKEGCGDHEDGDSHPDNNGGLVATACPGCLLYVLISKSDPKCPKCNSFVQMPCGATTKKPKIDLNISM